MIQAEHITKTFHGFKALDDMSLHVPKGTIYGLVGPNGAGKSTLIRHLTGIYRPDSGSILIDGLPVYDNPEAKIKFTYIPDSSALRYASATDSGDWRLKNPPHCCAQPAQNSAA